ncbi:ABC transporter ATP-binding protein [Caldinitratiruptor microaerophilus]|uniref:ABC transporter ATP-binding protein YjkB n=1 Tax=Caldinitratiruptor microaerophilus TaxID=671077 RepID=A0AA35CMA6_9FIRM|nr:ABC transporter ATP-binding protein [Caldinitratiruptor microaerophilus]BDG60998.1 putative ABC transporter ATP-binding protein YjkB [Caldinitratiruptor microaerophilus]
MNRPVPATHAAVEFVDVVFRRPAAGERGNGVAVLDGVSFTLNRGEVLAIVGPSGAGKTTLLHLVNRLLEADGGEVRVGGRRVRDWPPPALRRHAGLVFQSAPMLPGTVFDNLEAPLRLAGRALSRAEAARWLEAVELDPALLEQDAATLSSGQKQRVALLRTLATEPAVLLVDEVTSALDMASARVVESLVLDRVRTRGLSVLWVTHDEAQARRVAHRVLHLEGGRVRYLGPVDGYRWPAHPTDGPGKVACRPAGEGGGS